MDEYEIKQVKIYPLYYITWSWISTIILNKLYDIIYIFDEASKSLKIKVSDGVQAVSNPPNSTQPQSYGSIIEKCEITPQNSTENSSIMVNVVSDHTREDVKKFRNKNYSGRYHKIKIVNNRPAYKVSFHLTKWSWNEIIAL